MRRLILSLCIVSGAALAGPDDPSKFDASALGAQKAVYQFNLERPEDLNQALGYINNHLNSLKEYGDVKNSHLVVVAHGNELHAFSRLNRAAYPDLYDRLKALTDQGVSFRICKNAAAFRGYKPNDFYDQVTVVPAAMTELPKWEAKGYSYISGGVVNRTKRTEFLQKHPEIMD